MPINIYNTKMEQNNSIEYIARFFKNIDYEKLINNAGQGLGYIKKQAVMDTLEEKKKPSHGKGLIKCRL